MNKGLRFSILFSLISAVSHESHAMQKKIPSHIKLKSVNENTIHTIESLYAQGSQTIKELMHDEQTKDLNEPIPLHNVTSEQIEKWIVLGLQAVSLGEVKDFMNSVIKKLNNNDLVVFISICNYLDIPQLFEAAATHLIEKFGNNSNSYQQFCNFLEKVGYKELHLMLKIRFLKAQNSSVGKLLTNILNHKPGFYNPYLIIKNSEEEKAFHELPQSIKKIVSSKIFIGEIKTTQDPIINDSLAILTQRLINCIKILKLIGTVQYKISSNEQNGNRQTDEMNALLNRATDFDDISKRLNRLKQTSSRIHLDYLVHWNNIQKWVIELTQLMNQKMNEIVYVVDEIISYVLDTQAIQNLIIYQKTTMDGAAAQMLTELCQAVNLDYNSVIQKNKKRPAELSLEELMFEKQCESIFGIEEKSSKKFKQGTQSPFELDLRDQIPDMDLTHDEPLFTPTTTPMSGINDPINEFGQTALHCALMARDTESVQKLLNMPNIDLFTEDNGHQTPFGIVEKIDDNTMNIKEIAIKKLFQEYFNKNFK